MTIGPCRVVPSRRLLWCAAAIALPAAAAGGLFAGLAAPCSAVLAAVALTAAVDAFGGRRRARALHLSAPASVRLTKDVPGGIPLTIKNSSRPGKNSPRAGLAGETAYPTTANTGLAEVAQAVSPAFGDYSTASEGAAASSALDIRLALAPAAGVTYEQPVVNLAVPAGASLVDWRCTGTERGDRRIGEAHVEALSPLGLWAARARLPLDCALRVYPNLRGPSTRALFLRNPAPGARMRPQLGKGKEFESLRHYMPGDCVEDIHWKATARRGFPVVKQYKLEHAQEVYAVVDASRLSARQGMLDCFVDAALHLALIADRQKDRFGLVAFSGGTLRFVRAHGGMGHFRLCRETIYKLQPERVSPDFREIFGALQTNLRRRALLVFLTSLDDALLAESFEREIPMLARRHLVLVNVPRPADPLFASDPPDLDAVYSGLAGQLAWNRMLRLRIALRNCGVRLTLVDPARIKSQIAAGYLDVKRRQAL